MRGTFLTSLLCALLAYVMEHGGIRKPQQDAINKAVRGNICSSTSQRRFR